MKRPTVCAPVATGYSFADPVQTGDAASVDPLPREQADGPIGRISRRAQQ
jgi:hypothetical protein